MLSRLKIGGDPLEISIMKWEEIVAGIGLDNADVNCALCNAYRDYTATEIHECLKCPVYKKTGRDACQGSPWSDTWGKGNTEANKKELEFLKSLRNQP